MTESQSSSLSLNSRLSRVIPALLTRMCTPPSSSRTRATAASTEAPSETLQPTPIAGAVPPRPSAVACGLLLVEVEHGDRGALLGEALGDARRRCLVLHR